MFISTLEGAFQEARDVVALYEMSLGARLNMSKSFVIPFELEHIPLWLINSGCVISPPCTMQKYLDAPLGTRLTESQLFKFCLHHIGKRLSKWSSHTLSFTGRVLLIKDVFQDILVYHMMFTHTPHKAGLQLIRLLRNFLWGYNSNGGCKTALVAWNKICLS